VAAIASTFGTAASAGTVTTDGDQDIVIGTKGGLKIGTKDKAFSFQLGGRLQWDAYYFDGLYTNEDGGGPSNETLLRRGRLETKGTVFTDWSYAFSVNFGTDDGGEFQDAGFAYNGFKGHSIFLGRGKEPIGLEELTSSKSITTIERAFFNDATDTDDQSDYGIRYDGWTDTFTWSTGLFNLNGNVEEEGGNGDDIFAWTSRAVFKPIVTKDQVAHIGAAYSIRSINDDRAFGAATTRAGVRGGDRPVLLNLPVGYVSDYDGQIGLEALYIAGPASVQGEYFRRDLDGANGGPDADVNGFYIQAAYTITGEARGYKSASAVPDKIKPKSARGAYEVFARYDWVNADVDGSDDREVSGIRLGLNWYANDYIRFGMNYIYADSDNLVNNDEDGNAVALRGQIAF